MRIGTRFKLHAEALVILLLIGTMIWTSCGNGEDSAQRETQPPEVYITHEPVLPQQGDHIEFVAAADDESGVDTIAIFVDGENIKQCHGNRSNTHLQCTQVLGPYNQGHIVEYWAFAVDCEGNTAQSSTKRIEIGP
jgi:hypothetical protein